tara:strand:+ start:365 stop:1339 length:975 start_codon:yes stop_codon:yes gene_type:complete
MFGNILITGGTGSFGEAFLNSLLKINYKKKIVVFSRDELKQYNLKKKYSKNKNLRFFLGDIRDEERLNYAFHDVETVIHAAALKQVDTAEYNPFEIIKTNIIGSENVIKASIKQGVKKVIALSTDKATSPLNLYGATKLCSEKLFSSANMFKGKQKIRFSSVRYGNVFGSRGSIIHVLKNSQEKNLNFELTHKEMTRFNISLDESINLVKWAIKNMRGGEVFVPKLKSYNLIDLARAVNKNKKIIFKGIRPGEKIHEEMISIEENRYTYDIGKYFAIINPVVSQTFKYYNKKFKKVKNDYKLNSFNCPRLNHTDLKKIVNAFSK